MNQPARRPPPRSQPGGPMAGQAGMLAGEKARDFKATMKTLMGYLKPPVERLAHLALTLTDISKLGSIGDHITRFYRLKEFPLSASIESSREGIGHVWSYVLP